MKMKILVFNSGGGSGFQELVENSKTGILQAEIVALVTNKAIYSCVERAKKLGIPVIVMNKFEEEDYKKIIDQFKPDFICLSGWLKLTKGLDPKKTINIHPGPIERFGGKGMFGHHVHDAVITAYKRGEVTESAVCMHFVTEEYDEGTVFFRYPILIRKEDTAETLGDRVNKIEHGWQSYITNLILNGDIYLNDDGTITVPKWYKFV